MTPAADPWPDRVEVHLLGPDNAARLLGSDVFDGPVDPAWLAGFLAREGHALVFALADGAVAGFASGAELLHPDKAPEFYIREVGVNEAWRRRGIAAALVRAIIAHARGRGCATVWLATETDNDAARGLYRHLGAAPTEGVVVYVWDTLP